MNNCRAKSGAAIVSHHGNDVWFLCIQTFLWLCLRFICFHCHKFQSNLYFSKFRLLCEHVHLLLNVASACRGGQIEVCQVSQRAGLHARNPLTCTMFCWMLLRRSPSRLQVKPSEMQHRAAACPGSRTHASLTSALGRIILLPNQFFLVVYHVLGGFVVALCLVRAIMIIWTPMRYFFFFHYAFSKSAVFPARAAHVSDAAGTAMTNVWCLSKRHLLRSWVVCATMSRYLRGRKKKMPSCHAGEEYQITDFRDKAACFLWLQLMALNALSCPLM